MLIYQLPENKIEYKIGVISDTHGLLRPEAVKALYGSDLIVHAGDIGDPNIIWKLEELAPVTAIRGNVDTAPSLFRYPANEIIQIGDSRIFLIHNIADLDFNPTDKGINAVIYGHSHKAQMDTKNGVLYFNPGSAGKKRFNYPIGVGEIKIIDAKVSGRLIPFQFL